jgi:PDZ domain-containing protein
VSFPEDLSTLISGRTGGDRVTLSLETDDEAGVRSTREEELQLARCGDIPVCAQARPDQLESAFLGVSTETRDFDPGLPFTVDIDSGQVGGPSAGLAFTLTLLDALTPGSLTGTRTVAVTGTIQPDGTVGDVGGVVQKTAAAAAAGADVMLVPRGEAAQAEANPRGMTVIPVDDLDDALRALETIGGDPLPEEFRPPAEDAG